MSRIERVVLHRLRIPLRAPYVLSLGTIRALDTVLIEAYGAEGQTGYGEATVLTGYTHETIDETWSRAQTLGAAIVGLDPASAGAYLGRYVTRAPFAVTALATAAEMIEGVGCDFPEARTVPLLGLVSGHDDNRLEAEIEDHLAAGYRTLKVKVGFDVNEDLRRVGLIQRFSRGRARLRIDANQGFARDAAVAFAGALEPDGIELLEQTCDASDWEAAVAVARAARVPTMLDESIYGIGDVERAAQLGAARFIKFKLMKAGGLKRLQNVLSRIRALNMSPVLGNGVASDIGCWLEAVAGAASLDNAGEMNGFLKIAHPTVLNPLRVHDGAIHLPARYRPRLDREWTARCRTGLVEYSGGRWSAGPSQARA